jgi:hypothetical protein
MASPLTFMLIVILMLLHVLALASVLVLVRVPGVC